MGLKKPEIIVSVAWIFAIATALLLIPLQWIAAWSIASAVHECGHIMAFRLFKITLQEMQLGITGMRIKTQKLTAIQELVCALAGPLAGLFLLIFSRWIPRIAVCALIQSSCNLLPIYPLDGGRILSGLICAIFPHRNINKILAAVEYSVLLIMGCAVIWVTLSYSLNVIPVGLFVIFLIKSGKIKCTCKQGRERVQ